MSKCGKECFVSSGVHEGLTFGCGELDHYGYWSEPCHICARANDDGQKETRADIAKSMRSRGISKRSVRVYIAREDWLWLESWPYRNQARKTLNEFYSDCVL